MRQRNRLRTLPFNPEFRDEVAKAREILHIPKEGFADDAAREWREHHARTWAKHIWKQERYPIKCVPSDSPYDGFIIHDHIRQHLSDDEGSDWHYAIRTRLRLSPLTLLARRLIDAFGLPESPRLVDAIELYILTANIGYILPYSQFRVPWVRFWSSLGAYVSVLVWLDAHSTKDEWARLWDDVEKLVKQKLGSVSRKGRLPLDPLARDLHWWLWNREPERLEQELEYLHKQRAEDIDDDLIPKAPGPERIAHVWGLSREEAPDVDTVSKALDRMDSLMLPRHRLSRP